MSLFYGSTDISGKTWLTITMTLRTNCKEEQRQSLALKNIRAKL